jgi:hypothetical protein
MANGTIVAMARLRLAHRFIWDPRARRNTGLKTLGEDHHEAMMTGLAISGIIMVIPGIGHEVPVIAETAGEPMRGGYASLCFLSLTCRSN